jgi:hypothetical protein
MCCEDNHRKCCCAKPDHQKKRPQNCSPEDIRKCHGKVREHPCTAEGKWVLGNGR